MSAEAAVRCTQAATVPADAESVAAFLSDVRHLPRWTGFFCSVGHQAGDGRYEVRTALGTTVLTRIERPAPNHFVISSLIGGREERADLELEPSGSGTVVRFSMIVQPALAEAAARQAKTADGLAAQRARMRDELGLLRGCFPDCRR